MLQALAKRAFVVSLDRDFSTIIDWCVDKKSINLHDDKAKSVIFSSKHISQEIDQLNIY